MAFIDVARLRFERDTQKTVVEIEIDRIGVRPYRVAGMVGNIRFRHDAKYSPKPVNDKMVRLVPADKIQQVMSDSVKDDILIRGKCSLMALTGMEHNPRVIPPAPSRKIT